MPSQSTICSRSRRHFVLLAFAPILALVLALPPAAHAAPGDQFWSADFGAPGLTGSSQGWWSAVRSVVDWNGTLVVGGNITHAGGAPVNNVVRWNGAAFESLGDGLDGTVTSLAVVGGTLYAAGDFTSSGATPLPNVARWTGSAWAAVGTGSPDDATELKLVADGADLLLLGRFEAVGSPPVYAAHIARWNGSAWSDVGGFAPGVSGVLRAAARVGSILYVGGIKDDGGDPLCSFDGTTWTYDVGSLDGEVQHLAAVGTDLYLGGDFSSADDGAIALAQLARWDGVAMSALTNDVTDVLGMGEDGGQLFVHGAFVNHPGPFSSWWDGANWNAGPDRVWGRFGANLTTFARVGGDLILGGSVQGYYDYTDGGVIKGGHGVLAWDGTRFRAMGPGLGLADEGYVYGLHSYAGQLVAAGEFDMIGRLGAANGIAAWDGTQWSRLGTGLDDAFGNPIGEQLTTWNGRLVVTGYFSGAGGVPSQHIAAWNGTSWEGFNGGFQGQGARVVDYASQLIAGGLLMSEMGSGAPLGHVARWTGSQWQTVGTVFPSAGASALRLAVWNGTVVCAGAFSSVTGVPAVNIARWDGTTWSAMGAGLDGRVTALAVHGGELYASGDFSASGATPLPGRMARWDGSSWVALSSGLDYLADVLSSAGGRLFALGNFSTAGGTPVTRIAAWDGTTWSALGAGLGAGVGGNNLGGLCMAPFDGDLFVGGFFNTAGDKSAQRIARWELSTTTAVAAEPRAPGLRMARLGRNPGAGSAVFAIELPAEDDVTASVYDVRGRLVAKLSQGRLPAGSHRITWNGRDAAGDAAEAGIYWVRVSGSRETASEKVVWLR